MIMIDLTLSIEEMEKEWQNLKYYGKQEGKSLASKVREEIRYLEEIDEGELIKFYKKRYIEETGRTLKIID